MQLVLQSGRSGLLSGAKNPKPYILTLSSRFHRLKTYKLITWPETHARGRVKWTFPESEVCTMQGYLVALKKSILKRRWPDIG